MPHAFLGAKSKRRLIFTSRFADQTMLVYSSLGRFATRFTAVWVGLCLQLGFQQFGSVCGHLLPANDTLESRFAPA
jgi:hypothetical protein